MVAAGLLAVAYGHERDGNECDRLGAHSYLSYKYFMYGSLNEAHFCRLLMYAKLKIFGLCAARVASIRAGHYVRLWVVSWAISRRFLAGIFVVVGKIQAVIKRGEQKICVHITTM